MASKKYAYYTKGNKFAIVEKRPSGSGGNLAVAHCTVGGHNNQTDCEAAGGQWIPGSTQSTDNYEEYTSPVVDVANGIEIEYTYAPIYNLFPSLNKVASPGTRVYCNGWFVDEHGYLNIQRNYFDWDSVSAQGFAADKYIYIGGSSLWTGVHKIKSLGTELYHGWMQLYTKYPSTGTYSGTLNITFDTDETMVFAGAEDFCKAGDFIVIVANAALNATNHGLFKVGSIANDELTVSNHYTINDNSSSQYNPDDFELESTASLVSETVSCKAYIGYRDPLFVHAADYMLDESFEVDVNHQQSQAIVYYVKAKMHEEMGDFETREYFFREFKRAVEKESSNRKWGTYRALGFGMTK